jgi:hypothetical protein
MVKNGAPEAKIESPVRNSRCTIPDESGSTKELELNLTKEKQQQLTTQEGIDKGE